MLLLMVELEEMVEREEAPRASNLLPRSGRMGETVRGTKGEQRKEKLKRERMGVGGEQRESERTKQSSYLRRLPLLSFTFIDASNLHFTCESMSTPIRISGRSSIAWKRKASPLKRRGRRRKTTHRTAASNDDVRFLALLSLSTSNLDPRIQLVDLL